MTPDPRLNPTPSPSPSRGAARPPDPASPASPADTLARLRAGQLAGARALDLRGLGLTALPPQVLQLADTLQQLDISQNALTTLPEGLARCTRLHTVFASGNRFEQLPPVLGRLPQLDTLGFKANRITEVPAASLAPTLRWLILTDNRIPALPDSLADCAPMQKLMLAGNRLRALPAGIGRLQRLELVRLAANAFDAVHQALPEALLQLPNLAWLAHAGNPFSLPLEQAAARRSQLPAVPWAELELLALLGQGASGQVHAVRRRGADGCGGGTADEGAECAERIGSTEGTGDTEGAGPLALKLFKAAMTSDGLPDSELAAMQAAGRHPALLGAVGQLHGHPHGLAGLLLPRLASRWQPLAGPPSMASCTRDVYPPGLRLPPTQARAITQAATQALAHLHAHGITHGDLYAHNLLVDGQGGAVLSDFGAASFLPPGDAARCEALQAIDRRALAVLVAEVAQVTEVAAAGVQAGEPAAAGPRPPAATGPCAASSAAAGTAPPGPVR